MAGIEWFIILSFFQFGNTRAGIAGTGRDFLHCMSTHAIACLKVAARGYTSQ
jgi:hypothetical protein